MLDNVKIPKKRAAKPANNESIYNKCLLWEANHVHPSQYYQLLVTSNSHKPTMAHRPTRIIELKSQKIENSSSFIHQEKAKMPKTSENGG